MSEFTFNPALPLPIGFKIQEGKYGNQLNLFIPTESITHFIDHLQKLVDTKATGGQVYLGKEKGTVKTEGIYINAKALESEYGIYGQINPQKIETGINEDLPF